MNTNTLNTQIYEEATEWIILHRSDDLDAEAKRRFDAWLRESPQHLRAYLEMSTIWEDVPTLNRDWNPSADELIVRARAEGNVHVLAPEVPCTGGSGAVGIVASSPEESPPVPLNNLEALRGLEPLEIMKVFHDAEESTKSLAMVSSSGTFCVVGTVQAAQSEAKGEEESGANSAHALMEPPIQRVPLFAVPASNSTLMKVLAIAALVVLTVSSGAWYYLQRGFYTTNIGEQLTIALNDGTTVQLNSQTKLRVHYTDQERTIDLIRGQALFKVAKDPNRPFIVDSDGTRVRAVGTQFDVYKKTTGTQVTVVEGRVAVATTGRAGVATGDSPNTPEKPDPGTAGTARAGSSDGGTSVQQASSLLREPSAPHANHALQAQRGEVLLSAGEQILIADTTAARELMSPAASDVATVPTTAESASLAPVRANVEAATAWTQQRLVFDFTPLIEVAREFNRYNRRPLIIDDRSLETLNISGSFSSTDPTLLLRFLSDQPGIVVTESDGEIRISTSRAQDKSTHG